jgi:hypothetical protein
VSSMLGIVAMPYLGLYASSKFAACGHDRGTAGRSASFSYQSVLSRAHLFSHELRRAAPATPLAAYESARQSMFRLVQDGVEQGPDPEQVARRIVQLATQARPPLRSSMGPRASLLVALRQWLPQQLFEQVRRQVFHLRACTGFRREGVTID